MKRSSFSRYAVPGVAALALTLSACGGDGSGGGTLNGAGASSQEDVQNVWRASFQQDSDVRVNYDPIGSGGGREQFIDGGVPYAGSDAYLDEEELASATERCNDTAPLEIPGYVAPISIVYNLEGVDNLQLSPQTVASIFNEQITTWDDPAIAADNPDATLPSDAITPVYRGDASGTSENLTEYLAAVTDWPHEPSDEWPSGGESATGTSGVIDLIKGNAGYIGYADYAQAEKEDLTAAAIGVGDGFVAPSPEAAGAILSASTPVEGRDEAVDLAVDINHETTEADVYPIVLASYLLACQEYEDTDEAKRVKDYFTYILSDEGQSAAQENAGSAELPDEIRTRAQDAVDSIVTD